MTLENWIIPAKCRACGSSDLRLPYITRPGSKHPGEHHSECECHITGALCLNCRMFLPGQKKGIKE